jgi:hypothetical protein
MTRWSVWRSVLAGAVIGLVDAVGTDEERRRLYAPTPVVRFARLPAPRRPSRLWFLAPLTGWTRYIHRN